MDTISKEEILKNFKDDKKYNELKDNIIKNGIMPVEEKVLIGICLSLSAVNDYINRHDIKLSKLIDELKESGWCEDYIDNMKTIIDNIKESLKEEEPEFIPAPIDPEKELELSIEDAFKGVDDYIRNGCSSLSKFPSYKEFLPSCDENNRYNGPIGYLKEEYDGACYSSPVPLDGSLKD